MREGDEGEDEDEGEGAILREGGFATVVRFGLSIKCAPGRLFLGGMSGRAHGRNPFGCCLETH